MMPQQRPNMMYAQQQQQQMYPGGPPHHQMMGMMPHHPVRHGIRPGIRPGMPPMGPMGPHHGPGGPMGPMMNSMGPMGNHNMMPNGVGPPMNHGPGPGPQGNVSLPTTPLPKSSGGSIVGNGSNSPLHNSIATSNNNSSGNSTPSSSATPPHSARGTPPLSTATPTNQCNPHTRVDRQRQTINQWSLNWREAVAQIPDVNPAAESCRARSTFRISVVSDKSILWLLQHLFEAQNPSRKTL